MRDFGECEKMVNHPLIPLQEKRSKITFVNKNREDVRVITIDGCLIKQGLRCDYLVITKDETEHFVELKGSDVSHAVKQLEQSITLVSIDSKKAKKYSFIISSRCPLLSPKIQNLKLEFKKKYNSKLIIKNSEYEYIISETRSHNAKQI